MGCGQNSATSDKWSLASDTRLVRGGEPQRRRACHSRLFGGQFTFPASHGHVPIVVTKLIVVPPNHQVLIALGAVGRRDSGAELT